MEFKSQFDKYSLYWEKDPISEFARFLDENEVDDYKGDEEEEGSNLQSAKGKPSPSRLPC